MKYLFAASTLFAAVLLSAGFAGAQKSDPAKEALQGMQELIGGWKGTGSTFIGKSEFWKEAAEWSWKFKGKDVFFGGDMKESKLYKAGELRYIPGISKFQLTLTDKKDNRLVFEGELKKDKLTVERLDPATKETTKVEINTAANGDRLIYTFWVKPENRTIFNKASQFAYTREGVTFASVGGNKKPECCVTGGLGTSTVTFGGATYYVCCTGCRDAFNDNPAKIVAEFLAKKKAGN